MSYLYWFGGPTLIGSIDRPLVLHTRKILWPQNFNDITIALICIYIMFEMSQPLHYVINQYLSMYVPIFVEIQQPILTEQWALKVTKVKIKPKFDMSWTACLATRPLPKRQECTRLGWFHPVSSDVMRRLVRDVTYHSKVQRKHQNTSNTNQDPGWPRVNSQGRHIFSEDRNTTTIRSIEDPM